jgi:hypothetical protein
MAQAETCREYVGWRGRWSFATADGLDRMRRAIISLNIALLSTSILIIYHHRSYRPVINKR